MGLNEIIQDGRERDGRGLDGKERSGMVGMKWKVWRRDGMGLDEMDETSEAVPNCNPVVYDIKCNSFDMSRH